MSRDYELATENRVIYEWIRDNGHHDFIKKASECDMFTFGEQWDPRTKAKLARRKKPYLTINKVLPAVSTLQGEYLARRGDISFRAATGGDPDTAHTIDKLWMHFCQNQNLDWTEFMQFTDGVVRSRGFLDLRIDFDDSMQGEPYLTYLNSKDVGLMPGDHGMDPDKWSGVLITKWLSPRDIAEIYGVPIADVMNFADAPETSADYADWRKDSFGSPLHDHQIISSDQRQKYRMLRVLERQEWEYKSAPCFVNQETGDVREVPETWNRERIQEAMSQFGYNVIKRRVKKINWVVSVGTLMLHNKISPFRHFTPIPYFPFLVGGQPIGIVEQLRDPQNLLNKTLSQELHIVAGIANSGYKVKKGALSNMTAEQLQERGGEDGIVVEYNTNPGDIEKLQPNQVPTGLDRLSYKAGEAMQQISLVNDSMQGLNRSDEAGKAISTKAEQGATALSPIYASLDQSRRMLARNWLDLTQQFVSEPRAYTITNRSTTAQSEQVDVNQPQPDGSFLNDLTVGEYMINVTNISARDSYDMNQFDIMMQMIREGAPIPWSDIVNTLTILENKQEIVEYLKGQEGRTDPTEAQQVEEQLQQRLLAAQAFDKESSAQVKVAQAQKVALEAGQDGLDPTEAAKMDHEMQMQATEAELKSQQVQQEMQIKAQDAAMKLQLAQQEMGIKQKEMDMKMQEAEINSKQLLQKARMDANIASSKEEAEREKMRTGLEFLIQKQALELEKLSAQVEAAYTEAAVKLDLQEQQTDMAMEKHAADLEAKKQIDKAKLAAQKQANNAKLATQQPEKT